MKHSGFFIHCDRPAKSSSDSNIQQRTDSPVHSEAPIPINPNKNCEIPITNVKKIMEEHLPSNVEVNDDAKMLFPPCVSKYISFITAKAYEKCQDEHRKTLNAEDLLWAMEKLGFGDYVGPLRDYLNHYRCTKGNLYMNHGVSIPTNDGQAIYHNGPGFEPRLIGNHGPICGPMPVPSYGFTYEPGPRPVQVNGPNYGPMPWALYGPTPPPAHGLLPVPRPLPGPGMLQSTLSQQPPLSSSQGFSMDSEANLDVVGPTIGTGDGPRDGSSDKDIANFDPLVFLNLNFDNI